MLSYFSFLFFLFAVFSITCLYKSIKIFNLINQLFVSFLFCIFSVSNCLHFVFKESALWVDSFYKSKCPYVCLCVCHTFSLRLTVFLPPLPTSNVQTFQILESLGKSNGKNWSQIWKLWLIKGVKSPRRKKFVTDFTDLFTPF